MKYHAVMIDETGCEFGVDLEAPGVNYAYAQLAEDYPESRCDQLENEEETAERERAVYEHISRGGDWDDEGRPIYGPEYDYDDEEELEELDD